MIIYFQDTRGDKLTLNINNITIANWYADADFAEHTDMKRHTGGVLTMDKGAISKKKLKQKINTERSTESELVAVNDVSSHLLWTKNVLR